MAARPWVFRQIRTGVQEILTGWSAPFGRPRKGPLVEDGVELRVAETHYDGADGDPDYHVFGSKNDDYELHGRWMDKVLGAGGANALIDRFKKWAKSGEMSTIQYGDIIVARGLLQHFIPSRESEAEADWKMIWRIASDTTATQVRATTVPTLPSAIIGNLADELRVPLELPSFASGIEIDLSFLDGIDDAITSLGALTGQLVNLANQVDSAERATFNELARLRATLQQVRTAIITVQTAVDATPNDAALAADSAATTVAWLQYRARFDSSVYASLAACNDADARLELMQRGEASTSHRVVMGETWESISSLIFGGPDKADLLRRANGVRGGTKPTPGTDIQVPLTI